MVMVFVTTGHCGIGCFESLRQNCDASSFVVYYIILLSIITPGVATPRSALIHSFVFAQWSSVTDRRLASSISCVCGLIIRVIIMMFAVALWRPCLCQLFFYCIVFCANIFVSFSSIPYCRRVLNWLIQMRRVSTVGYDYSAWYSAQPGKLCALHREEKCVVYYIKLHNKIFSGHYNQVRTKNNFWVLFDKISFGDVM